MLQAPCTASLFASVVASSLSYLDPQRWLCNFAFLLNLIGCAGALTENASLSQPEKGRIGQYIAILLPTIAAAVLSGARHCALGPAQNNHGPGPRKGKISEVQSKGGSDSYCGLLASIVVGIHDCIVWGKSLILAYSVKPYESIVP